MLARPLLARVVKVIGGRRRAAGGLVIALVIAVFVPLGSALASLSFGAVDLVRSMLASGSAKNALVAVVSGDDAGGAKGGRDLLEMLASPGKVVALLEEHGAVAARVVGGALGAATHAGLGLFVFFYAVYVFLVDGPSYYEWLKAHAPIEARHTERLAAAFVETGRGLFVGVGLTGLAQGIVATITYFALGVPRALVLGLLTCVASLIPSVGTALIWVPVAIGLALAGKTVSAAVMAGVGVLVIGSVDNLLRPVFARFGNLDLSTFVLLTSIFGGLAMFGTWGLVLGPLFARLAKEGLVLARADRQGERLANDTAATSSAESET